MEALCAIVVSVLGCRYCLKGSSCSGLLLIASPARSLVGFLEVPCQEDVLHLELPNKSGALANVAGKLAAKEINITLAYQTSAKGSEKANVVLAVSELEKAARVR